MCISGLSYHFNVMLGRLIREVQPDLMNGLIQASKDGDMSKFQSLYGSEVMFSKDEIEEESESDDEVEVCHIYPLLEYGLESFQSSILSLGSSNE